MALVTTIGTAAFWLVPGDQRTPFGGPEPLHAAAQPTTSLTSPTGSTVPGPSGGSNGSHGKTGQSGGFAGAGNQPAWTAGYATPRRTTASSRTPSPQATSIPPTPTKKPKHTKPPTSLPVTTPPLATTPPPPFLSVPTISISVGILGLP